MLIWRDINTILAAVSKNFNWWQFSQTQNCSQVLKKQSTLDFERMLQGNLNQLHSFNLIFRMRSQHICDTCDNLTKEPRHVTWFHLKSKFTFFFALTVKSRPISFLAFVRKCVWLATTRRTSRSNASSFLPRSCKLFWSKRSSLATVSTSKCSCHSPPMSCGRLGDWCGFWAHLGCCQCGKLKLLFYMESNRCIVLCDQYTSPRQRISGTGHTAHPWSMTKERAHSVNPHVFDHAYHSSLVCTHKMIMLFKNISLPNLDHNSENWNSLPNWDWLSLSSDPTGCYILGSNRSCRKGLKAFGTSEGLLLKDSRFPGSHDAAAPIARWSLETLGFGFSEMMVWWMQKTSKYAFKHSKPSEKNGCDVWSLPGCPARFQLELGETRIFNVGIKGYMDKGKLNVAALGNVF